jgi:hypothetical protein
MDCDSFNDLDVGEHLSQANNLDCLSFKTLQYADQTLD